MTSYDAIVVGARCAGSPAAMLPARQGHRILVVDRATFPSDTISTHLIHTPGRHGARAMIGFACVIAGVISPAEFFSPENVGRIFAAAG
jgi:glycine/D-amino acid oxidase-like deaminating enzyme